MPIALRTHAPGPTRDRIRLVVLGTLLAAAQAAAAGVFGDGDPANGTEDDRRTVSQGPAWSWADDWYRSAGTVVCDGAVRGSATLLAPTPGAEGGQGSVIATAAHVLFDLEAGQPWQDCAFHYLGLGALPGHRAALRRDRLLLGAFDPASDPSSPLNGSGDWAFAWLGPDWVPPYPAAGLTPAPAAGVVSGSARLGLVAWHAEAGEMSVSAGCEAVFSVADDLGGGAWTAQLLDSCDSGHGASGGGMVVTDAAGPRLVGIRGGQHWDPGAWPRDRWPDGPAAGTRWDPKRFTNYARAFDDALLEQLDQWLEGLARAPTRRKSGTRTN